MSGEHRPMRFELCTAGRIVFGAGVFERLGELWPIAGRRCLLVVGADTADRRGWVPAVEERVEVTALARCAGEPTVEDVDRCVASARAGGAEVVIALGGGSVLDCGKAAAGMITNPGSLVDYLEGVGQGLQLTEPPVPMIAVPTTAGTGSEVTKNAVISGPGYKKSIRSPQLIPDVALVDPELLRGTPRPVIAACGLDALTQLVEAYLSTGASPLTDPLALQGIRASGRFLERFWIDSEDAEAREGVALASLLGGICLANAGLGAVHGFASPLGAELGIAHGVCCAALLVEVTAANLEHGRGTEQEERLHGRFAAVAEALLGERFAAPEEANARGLARLGELRKRLEIPRLGELRVLETDIPKIVAGSRGSSMRSNPILLTDEELAGILRRAL